MPDTMTDSYHFQNALHNGDLAELAKVPKTDLHNHSIFGTRIKHIESWIHAPLRCAPARMAFLDEMRDYAHEVLYPHILTRAGFEFTAESAVCDALTDGVVLLEMSLDVRFMSLYDTMPDGFLSFVASLVEAYRGRINFRPEIGVSKNRSPATEVPLAHICICSGLFCSIDLYGNETAQPPDAYRNLYAEAKSHGLKLKAHVGEFAGSDLIAHTIDVLHLDEVQHGVAAIMSTSLMERLRHERIRLNICPSSNVALGVVSDISVHPIRILIDNGVRVSINTDDLTIFGQSVSQEYLLLYRSGLLSAETLDFIRRDSLSP